MDGLHSQDGFSTETVGQQHLYCTATGPGDGHCMHLLLVRARVLPVLVRPQSSTTPLLNQYGGTFTVASGVEP